MEEEAVLAFEPNCGFASPEVVVGVVELNKPWEESLVEPAGAPKRPFEAPPVEVVAPKRLPVDPEAAALSVFIENPPSAVFAVLLGAPKPNPPVDGVVDCIVDGAGLDASVLELNTDEAAF